MARTPSMTRDEAEKIIGLRGSLKDVTKDNRPTVAKWMTALGFRAAFVAGLSNRELLLAYNDTTKEAEFLTTLKAKWDKGVEMLGDDDGEIKSAAALSAAGNGHDLSSAGAPTDVAAAIQALIRATAIPATVDEQKVREIIKDWASGYDELLADIISRVEGRPVVHTHTVNIIDTAGQTRALNETVHPLFPKLLQACQARGPDGYHVQIFLAGEASSGKTTACKQVAKALGLNWYFNGAISMPHEMLGFIDAGGTYHTTPFRQAYEHGGVYTFDEVDRCDPVALLAVNPHLANGTAVFPDGMIKRHKDCIIIATANTWGQGGTADYCGATKLDAAFLSRFPVRLAWNIDEDFEISIAGDFARCVQEARRKAKRAGLKVMIDVRMSLAGAALIAAGFNTDEAFELTVLANLNNAQKGLVR